MKIKVKTLTFATMLALAPALAWGAPGSGIATTAHDFTTRSGNTQPVGLCTFCHTPHKAAKTLLLWNHTLSSNTFNWDEPKTTAGTTFPTIVGNTYKGPTAKCLSCHDGSVAIGDVAWFNAAARGGAAALNASTIASTDAHSVGFGGAMAGNHPVGMPYPYNNLSNTYNGATTGTAAVLTEWVGDPQTKNIRVFNDSSGIITAGAVAGKSGIECSSCHDPHNKASTGDYFLRGAMTGNTDAYLCLKCHIK